MTDNQQKIIDKIKEVSIEPTTEDKIINLEFINLHFKGEEEIMRLELAALDGVKMQDGFEGNITIPKEYLT